MDCKKDKSKLNSNAVQNPLTEKPFINFAAKRMIAALITKRNKPKVMMVIGKVKMTKIGFTKASNTANITAKIMADVNPSASSTPGRNFAKTTTATAVKSNLIIKFMSVLILVDDKDRKCAIICLRIY